VEATIANMLEFE